MPALWMAMRMRLILAGIVKEIFGNEMQASLSAGGTGSARMEEARDGSQPKSARMAVKTRVCVALYIILPFFVTLTDFINSGIIAK